MSKWITKPKVKYAEQLLDGQPWPEGVSWCEAGKYKYVTTIHEQVTRVEFGDFIVQEPDGVHYYPCKPNIWLAGHDSLEGCVCGYDADKQPWHHHSCFYFGG